MPNIREQLGLRLGVGTIDNTIHESGAAAMQVENELIQIVKESPLIRGDVRFWRKCFFWLSGFQQGQSDGLLDRFAVRGTAVINPFD